MKDVRCCSHIPNDLFRKISIGTAQFGLNYGISNFNGKTSLPEVRKIYSYMRNLGIDEFDTAQSYGNSETIIGDLASHTQPPLKVVTKFSLGKSYNYGDLFDLINISKLKLRSQDLHGILLHNFNDYLRFPGLWDELNAAKDFDLISNIGFSIYELDELEIILSKRLKPDIIQIPFSIFDQRFKEYFGLIRANGITIYARSMFMQGLLLMNTHEIPQKLSFCVQDIEKLRSFSSHSGINLNSLCLNYVLNQNDICKVIIGITNLRELENNITLLKDANLVKSMLSEIENLKLSNEKLKNIIQNLIEIQVKRGSQS